MGIHARFVLGHWPGEPALERAADEEEAQAGDILRLPVAETYENLPMKVRQLALAHAQLRLAACARVHVLQHDTCTCARCFADVKRRPCLGILHGACSAFTRACRYIARWREAKQNATFDAGNDSLGLPVLDTTRCTMQY